jgi:hypothetical protein
VRGRPDLFVGSAVLVCLLSLLSGCGSESPQSSNNCPWASWCTDPVNHNPDPPREPYPPPNKYVPPPAIDK